MIEMPKACPICGRPLNKNNAAIDHIVPIRLGGTGNDSNLRYICNECNINKADHFNPILEYYLLLLRTGKDYDSQLGAKIDYVLRSMPEEDRGKLKEKIEAVSHSYSFKQSIYDFSESDYSLVAENAELSAELSYEEKMGDLMRRSLVGLNKYDFESEEREFINGCTFIFKKNFPIEQYREQLQAYAEAEEKGYYSVFVDENGKVIIY